MPDQQPTRRRVLYSGHVQGVGFRYTTRDLASRFDLGGTVRNLPDGRVELFAEGPVREVEGLLAAIRDHFDGMIDHESSETVEPTGDRARFEILR